MDFEWTFRQANEVMFVLTDATTGQELAGLGTDFTVQVARNGEDFVGSAGSKTEIGNGWYRYTGTVKEAEIEGAISLKISAAGAAQQNLVGTVK